MAGKIFINYRRGDDPGFAGRLFDRLEEAFTAERIFIDIDNIEPGLDFVRVLEDQVDACDVLLAVIGPNWLTAKDEAGARRLDNPNDFVRIEIESGLKLGKRIIPVLVNNADMPRADDLPESLKPLSRRNAVRLTHERFRADAQGLVKQLEKALLDAEAAHQAARTAAEEAAKRRVEEEAAKAAEAERQQKEKTRLDAIAGLSAEQIAKAEELANWEFIKDSKDEPDYRDHIARFPQGVTLRMARTRLETILWAKLGFTPTAEALEGFLAEFPDGARAAEAAKTLAKLKAKTETRPPRASTRKKAEPAPAALKAEPTQAETEDSTAAPVTARKRWIGLAAMAVVYAFLAVLPSALGFGAAGFVIAALVGVALLWWFFAPVSKAERSETQATATAVDDELSWPAWAYAALAVSPLVCIFVHVANDADIFDHFDLMLYVSLAALIAALALAFAQRQTLSAAEIGLYWLGAALGAAFAVFASSAKTGWSYFGNNQGLAIGSIFAVVLLSAVGFAYWRRGRSSPLELAFYWLGSVLWLGLTAKVLFSFYGWNLLNATDTYFGFRAAGVVAALAIAAATALALLRYAKPRSTLGSEVGIYWLGCTTLALPALGWMFIGYQWNWYSTYGTSYQFASGCLAAFILAAVSAGFLAYRRLHALKALEVACYWFGLTLTAMFAAASAGSLVTPGWDTSGNSGWTSNNSLVLAAALTVAAALAYWWWRPAMAAHRLSAKTAANMQVQPRASAATAERGDEAIGWPAWTYAALAIVPLLYASVLYATELGMFEPLLTFFLYVCFAALIAGPVLALAQLTRLRGAEVGLYWLGAALGGALAIMLRAYQTGWTWTVLSSEQGGFVVLLGIIVFTAAVIAYSRRDRLTPVELSLYWLGCVFWGALTLRSLFMNADLRLLSAPDTYAAARASGLMVALALAASSALALLFYRKSDRARGSEVGVYWLGCVLITLLFIPWLFDGNEWNWYGESNATNQLASGLLLGFVVAAISAAVLIYLRRAALGALELGCYWAGLTIAALAAFALNVYTGAVWGARELVVLGIALAAAAAITYWWNRPALAGASGNGLAT